MQGLGVLVAAALIIGWLFFGLFKPAPVYTGYFYYDTSDLGKHWTQSDLSSMDACRSWVNTQIAHDFDGDYDYECGRNCKYRPEMSIAVCETTER